MLRLIKSLDAFVACQCGTGDLIIERDLDLNPLKTLTTRLFAPVGVKRVLAVEEILPSCHSV